VKIWALAGALVLLALAGCGGTKDTTYTCADGLVIDTATLAGSDAPGFDPETACPKPVPPAVHLGAASYTVAIYRSLAFAWQVDAGNYTGGHTMLTSIRLSHHHVDVASGTNGTAPEAYGRELVRLEHQNLPYAFNATTPAGTFTFTGNYYLRAYATVHGDGLPEGNYWSDEVPINVTDVQPTGTTVTVTHKVGDFQGGLDFTTANVRIGDNLVFRNDDVRDHTFHLESAPKNATFDDAAVASMAASGPLFIKVPGTYVWKTDDIMPLTLTVNASVG
jgi:hypothetical protein